MRTFDNRVGNAIVHQVYLSESNGGIGIGRRELERKTGFASKTTGKWLERLRDVGVIRRDHRIPIRLTDWVKDRIDKKGKYELIIDHRIRKRSPQHHSSRQKIPRGKYFKQKKEEYKRKEERIKVAILRLAASRGISRYRCLMNGAVWPVMELPSVKKPYNPEEDRKLLEDCFDYLTLSLPPILETFYNPELGEECLEIKDPLLREFIISADKLLGHLIIRMELESTHGTKKKPTKAEVDWVDFFYPKEGSNIIFTHFYEIQKQKVKDENIDNEYEYKRKYYDYLIRQTWNDIQTKYNYLKLNYPEIFNLMLSKVYPEFMRNQR